MGKKKAAKKKWLVSIPFTGVAHVEVEADDAQSAKDAAMGMDIKITGRGADAEWEFCERVVEGNVFCGMQNAIEAEEVK